MAFSASMIQGSVSPAECPFSQRSRRFVGTIITGVATNWRNIAITLIEGFECKGLFTAVDSRRTAMRILGQVHVERVDFLEPRVPQEEWASIRGHPVVGPEAAGMQAASLL